MPSHDELAHSIDWRSWLALGWMTVFAVLYAVMVVHEKAPALLTFLRVKD